MPVKRIIILANSVKKREHCIAGREVIERRGVVTYGDWIRPVSRRGEGELSWSDCRFPDGKTPKIFDVVDIPLEAHEGSASQPENWFIDPTRHWKKVDFDDEDIPPVNVDVPDTLWIDPGGRNDRIAPDALARIKCKQSLYLVNVTQFRIQIGWKEWEGRHTRRRRALFRYRGRDYDFSLTDPMMDKNCSPFPQPTEGTKTIRLGSGSNQVLCVSLAPPFLGFHYKIVATVIEPNDE